MRIFKSEVREMKKDGAPEAAADTDAVEGRVVNHPKPTGAENRTGDGTDVPPPNRA
jgi:sec-independent protein translocase protein TatA